MITIRPETEGSTLVIEAAGKLTTKDYEERFIPKLNESKNTEKSKLSFT